MYPNPSTTPATHPNQPPRHGQDAVGARRGEPHGRVLHPRDRVGAGAEVRGRRGADGAGAVHHGAVRRSGRSKAIRSMRAFGSV